SLGTRSASPLWGEVGEQLGCEPGANGSFIAFGTPHAGPLPARRGRNPNAFAPEGAPRCRASTSGFLRTGRPVEFSKLRRARGSYGPGLIESSRGDVTSVTRMTGFSLFSSPPHHETFTPQAVHIAGRCRRRRNGRIRRAGRDGTLLRRAHLRPFRWGAVRRSRRRAAQRHPR